MRPAVESIALYAVLLRDCAANRHVATESLLEDLECGHSGELTFAQMLAHGRFTDLDWALVNTLCDGHAVTETARKLYCEHEQLAEGEALLHAVYPNGRRTGARWAAPIRARWRDVRLAMTAFEAEGITLTTNQMHDIAEWAYTTASGASLEEARREFGSRWDYLDEDDELPVVIHRHRV